jgi:hypothetical protein
MDDVIFNICLKLDTKSLKIVFKVNKQWYNIVTQHYFWQQYHRRYRLYFSHHKNNLVYYIQSAIVGFKLKILRHGYTLKLSLSNDMVKTLCHQLVDYNEEYDYKYNTIYITTDNINVIQKLGPGFYLKTLNFINKKTLHLFLYRLIINHVKVNYKKKY